MLQILKLGIIGFLFASALCRGVVQSAKSSSQSLFQQGQAALEQGHLEQAEQAFRKVIALDPQSAGAYANLGVVYMREKRWPQALAELHKAQQLSPQIAGIRLNIGLVYYKQAKFRDAIPPFESVMHDDPTSTQ